MLFGFRTQKILHIHFLHPLNVLYAYKEGLDVPHTRTAEFHFRRDTSRFRLPRRALSKAHGGITMKASTFTYGAHIQPYRRNRTLSNPYRRFQS